METEYNHVETEHNHMESEYMHAEPEYNHKKLEYSHMEPYRNLNPRRALLKGSEILHGLISH